MPRARSADLQPVGLVMILRNTQLMTPIRPSLVILLFSLAMAGANSQAQDPDKSEAYGKELPRVEPMSPEDSMKAMVLQPGFRVELVASEPQIHDPIAAEFDEHGRLYVVQLPQYNSYVIEGFEETGSIALLEDVDSDGHFEKSTLFATGLKYPSAIAVWDGGVFVGDAPDLLYLKDTDGDGKADLREVVLTGFGNDKAGESHLNSIRWGLDNRFHIWTSLSGGNITAPAAEGAEPQSARTRSVILDPRNPTDFELSSGGGQHGMSMDDWGRKFTCGNSQPALGIMYDDRYITRNPQLEAPAAAVDVTPDGKHTKLFRISPPEPWRQLRTRLRKSGEFRGSDEGGTPFGFFTGATGITIYRGDAWPETHAGNAFVGEVANNLIYRAKVTPNGVGVIADRADPEKEFLASEDIWFRPVQFTHGPDGNLLVLDMYRELIEGAAFLPPEFLEHIDAVSGNDRGRIYRFVREDEERRPAPKFDDLVGLLDHPNGWHRDTAARLIYQRQDQSVVPDLRQMLANAESAIGRATALHVLEGLNSVEESDVLALLADPSPAARIQALRLSEAFLETSIPLQAQVAILARDSDINVRFQAAFTLGSFDAPASADALAKLAIRDVEDSWLRMAVLSSTGKNASSVFQRLVADEAFTASSEGQALLAMLARQIGASGNNSDIARVVGALSPIDQATRMKLVQALVEKQTAEARAQILKATSGDASEMLKKIVAQARQTAADPSAETEARTEAIRSLHLASFASVRRLLKSLMAPSQTPPVQQAALEVAAEFSDAEVANLLLESWSGLSPRSRALAVETMLSRGAWLNQLLDAVEAGTVKTFELDPARVQLLRQHSDKEVVARVTQLFVDAAASREAVVKKYQPALEMAGDEARGKEIFRVSCSACHRLEDVGNEVGAELKGIRQRGMASVLLNILDPNREVKPEFLAYAVTTTDG
ncbi:MAG: putative membrane-bound dehydrogenase-like protein, partial [Verrucomicrobiales bacterium]